VHGSKTQIQGAKATAEEAVASARSSRRGFCRIVSGKRRSGMDEQRRSSFVFEENKEGPLIQKCDANPDDQ
jgi:hypothetical protein